MYVIFQPLHAKDGYEGNGNGLALGKKIVEDHGRDILVDADARDRTTLRFTLPADHEEPAAAPAALAVAPGDGGAPAWHDAPGTAGAAPRVEEDVHG